MNYEEFKKLIAKNVALRLGTEYTVARKEVIKNNDSHLTALVISKKGCNIAPTVYLEKFYEDYKNGRDIDDIVEHIILINENGIEKLNYDPREFEDFEKIKDKIVFKLVNKKSNEEFLQKIPYVPYLDLAICFYCIVESFGEESATIQIDNSHLKMWNKTREDLFKLARKNTPKLLQFDIKSMDTIIYDMLYEKMKREPDKLTIEMVDDYMMHMRQSSEGREMFVLSNKKYMYGAASILYKDLLKDLANSLNKDIVVLPSSVHEVILMPVDVIPELDELNEMIRCVNFSEVKYSDVLSDHAYIFYKSEMRLSA